MYDDGPSWVVTEDSRTLQLVLPAAPDVIIAFDVAMTDALLANVATLRASMVPSIDFATAPDPALDTATFGAWRLLPQLKGGAILATAHPGYGWVTIALEPRTVADLIRELIAISNREVPASADEATSEDVPWERGS